MGLRSSLSNIRSPCPGASHLAASIQLASAPWRYKIKNTNQQTRPDRGQPVEAPQLERYSQLLHTHVVPAPLGDCRLQKLTAPQISERYATIAGSIAPRTLLHVHVVFSAALSA